jgi:hypothetical protein
VFFSRNKTTPASLSAAKTIQQTVILVVKQRCALNAAAVSTFYTVADEDWILQ